jgi:DNA repair protein RadA/Sms
VPQAEQRVLEAKKLGFKRCILPEVSVRTLKKIEGIELIGVKNINEAGNVI